MSIGALRWFRTVQEQSKAHNLQSRQATESQDSSCSSGSASIQDYDLSLHISAVFIVLAASFMGCLIPASSSQYERHLARNPPSDAKVSNRLKKIFNHCSFVLRHFGAGIIFATAFVHLLFEGFSILNDPCVGQLAFEPTSPAIAMGACFLIFVFDFLVLRPLRRSALESESLENAKGIMSASGTLEKQTSSVDSFVDSGSNSPAHARLAKWNVFALEGGIVFHSVIIGVTVGATGGTEFIPLLIAICFHQLCEGLGLATRISLLATSVKVHYILFFAFSISTPLGVAIGTGVRSSYNGSDRNTLLALGILNSVSAGILIYSALVQLMVGDFLHNNQMLRASLKRCLVALLSFALGAAAMSVLGKWT